MTLSHTLNAPRVAGAVLLMASIWFAGTAAPATAQTASGAPMLVTPASGEISAASIEEDQSDWLGHVPLATLPSPATESLAGRGPVARQMSAPASAAGSAPADETVSKPRMSAVPQPPQPPEPPVQAPDLDTFTSIGSGYSTYQNDRYGTFISYPSTYFLPEPPPGNGDGRTFISVDGTARFLVYAAYNALQMTIPQLMNEGKSGGSFDRVTYEKRGEGWYVLSGFSGTDIVYRKVLVDGMDGLIQTFDIRYPQARKAEFDTVVTYMAGSLGP